MPNDTHHLGWQPANQGELLAMFGIPPSCNPGKLNLWDSQTQLIPSAVWDDPRITLHTCPRCKAVHPGVWQHPLCYVCEWRSPWDKRFCSCSPSALHILKRKRESSHILALQQRSSIEMATKTNTASWKRRFETCRFFYFLQSFSRTDGVRMLEVSVKTLDGKNRSFCVPDDVSVENFCFRISQSILSCSPNQARSWRRSLAFFCTKCQVLYLVYYRFLFYSCLSCRFLNDQGKLFLQVTVKEFKAKIANSIVSKLVFQSKFCKTDNFVFFFFRSQSSNLLFLFPITVPARFARHCQLAMFVIFCRKLLPNLRDWYFKVECCKMRRN